MHTKKRYNHSDGPQLRLAESSVAAVDVCECGMLLLHIGAMTLRLSPCAASELLRTLEQALTPHSKRFEGEHAPADGVSQLRRCDA
jgi:hypothetical protein